MGQPCLLEHIRIAQTLTFVLNLCKLIKKKDYFQMLLRIFLLLLLLFFNTHIYGTATMKLTLASPQFTQGATIPSRYTCDAENYSIPLEWTNMPQNTQSLVLIMDDPDAPMGTWDHWLVFNIPPSTHALSENLSSLPQGAKSGHNSFGNEVYGGPCPPDREHRYFFKLYALDTLLDLPQGARKADIEKAMQGHILEQAELMGRYDRKR